MTVVMCVLLLNIIGDKVELNERVLVCPEASQKSVKRGKVGNSRNRLNWKQASTAAKPTGVKSKDALRGREKDRPSRSPVDPMLMLH